MIILLVLLLVDGCGEATPDCHSSYTMVVGEFTGEEAGMIGDVICAFREAGYPDPHYYVAFIHSPSHPIHGTTWGEFRIGGVKPKDPGLGYNGWCDRQNCMAYVRATKEKGWGAVRSDLVHELVHGLGYEHGDEMKAVETGIRAHLK